MLGTVPDTDFAFTSKDAKLAMKKLAARTIEAQKEHFEKWRTARGKNHEFKIDGEEEEEFIKNEKTLLSALTEELNRIKSCKDGYSALPPFILNHFKRDGKPEELKLFLSNHMTVTVKNGMSSFDSVNIILID